MTTLIPVLGDQLSHGLASLRDVEPGAAVVLMAEVAGETGYVKHHKAKIALVLSAMRHFAAELEAAGWRVDYVRLDAPDNRGSLTAEVARAAAAHGAAQIRVTEPGEWRVAAMMAEWAAQTRLPVEILPDDRFLCSRDEFAAWAEARRTLVMEDFYRAMRRRTGVLMAGGKPVGGRWNFDSDNRKRAPRGLAGPVRAGFAPDTVTTDVLTLVAERFADHFGDLDGFAWPVTRAQARAALDGFVRDALPRFGDYQDAMVDGDDLLFHSLLSPALNLGLLLPSDLIDAALAAFDAGCAPLNAVEGFVRQVLGWREYVRGIYWREGPGYMARNALGATRDLPAFYWEGGSGMRCLDTAVEATRRRAHAHHIRRLMVLGNFALLAGVDPVQVHEWYLVVYADAYEWVELPNTLGMSQFADGGLLGSKPYAASGAYIDRMSDHCRHCRFDVKARVGPDACPFNALYWDFLARNRPKLAGNRRMEMPYRSWDRMAAETQQALRDRAAEVLAALPGGARHWAVAGTGTPG